MGNKKTTTEFGAGFRMDDVSDIELAKAPNRIFKESIQKGDIKEFNGYLYVNQDVELSNKWNLNASLRHDNFKFQYKDKLAGATAFSKKKRNRKS